MKKLYLLLIPLFALVLTGCGSKYDKVVCEYSSTLGGIKMDSKYTIEYEGKYAKKANFYEEYTPEDVSALDKLETLIKNTYEKANNSYGGYDINVKKSGSKVIADIDVDYDKMNISKAMEDDESVKQYAEDGKMSVEKMKALYTKAGFTCK